MSGADGSGAAAAAAGRPAGGVQVPLPGDRRLTVRPVGPGDADGLELLYAGLSADDVHLRFFAAYHPPRAFFDHLANASREGGYGLVAVLDGSPATIVGEADYFLLDNGNGELAVTVAADWRGWLGPYLLDVLLEAAAARGVPNLEAEILVENRRMLALIRRRVYATVDGTDAGVVRVALGTAARSPTWPVADPRPRILVEAPGGRWRHERAVRAAGFQVMTCPGPRPRAGAPCPALTGQPCPLARAADVIVCALPVGEEPGGRVRAAHAVVHPGRLVVAGRSPLSAKLAAVGEPTVVYGPPVVVDRSTA